jgi:hypothetical protein
MEVGDVLNGALSGPGGEPVLVVVPGDVVAAFYDVMPVGGVM